MKSFKPKDGSSDPPGPGRNGEGDFHGEKRSNCTHASTTNSEAQLFRKGRGKEAKLSFMGHALMENRSGLVVATTVTKATGTAEHKAAEEMIVRHSPGVLPHHSWMRQGLRRGFIRGRHARAQRDAACCAEYQRATFRDRQPHHAAS